MAILHIKMVAGTGVASSGNAGPAFIVVSVTDQEGRPELSIAENEVTFSAVVNPSGISEQMTHLINHSDRGFYFFSLFPGTGGIEEQWQQGEYIIGLAIEAAAGRGQSVALLHILSGNHKEESV